MESKKYLLAIVSQENLTTIIQKGIIGFKSRFLKTLKKINVGDELILYVKGKRLFGSFYIDSLIFEDNKELFLDNPYPLRFKLKKKEKLKRADFTNDLIPKLDFITNKIHWMGNFQGKSLINLSKKDFKLLEKKINEI